MLPPTEQTLDTAELLTLQVLLEERHVTRAAARLGISQSTLSHRLRRLRELLDDPLLVRDGATFVLSARAARMAPLLDDAVARLREALTPAVFDPATATGTVRVMMPDLLAPALPAMMGALRDAAPHFSLAALPVTPDLGEWLGSSSSSSSGSTVRTIQLAFAPLAFASSQTRTRRLGALRFAVAARADHPLWDSPLTLQRWLACGHVVVRGGSTTHNVIDAALERAGHTRRVALETSGFLAGLHAVAATDLVMNIPTPVADRAAATLGLCVRPLPPGVPVPEVPFGLLWHDRFQDDDAHQRVRGALGQAVARHLQGEPASNDDDV